MIDARLPLRLLPTLAWMLLPFVVIPLGLYEMQDFRITVYLYGFICCVIPALLQHRREPFQFGPLNISPFPLLGLCVVSMVALLWLWRQIAPYMLDWPNLRADLQEIALTPKEFFWGYAVYFVVVNPILEECFWRGVVYRRLKTFLPRTQALVVSSVFFGAWHWSVLQHVCTPLWAVLLTLPVMLGGMVFGLLYEKTGTLSAPVILHGLGADLPLIIILLEAMARM